MKAATGPLFWYQQQSKQTQRKYAIRLQSITMISHIQAPYKRRFVADPELKSNAGYRSELQERALIVSLQMFSLILERCVSLLQEHINTDKTAPLPLDAQVLLPAIKIWCDWMLCHSSVWNPPPSTQDYRVG